MTRSFLRASGWLGPLLLPLALACGSTGVGNPGSAETGTLSLAIVSDDDDDSAPEPGASAGDLPEGAAPVIPLARGTVERAALVIGSVRWLPCDDSQRVITQTGPFLIDLVAGTTQPALPAFAVPAGGVCGFDAPLAPKLDSAEFLGRSLLFSGTRADGVRFILFANLRATLRLRAPRGEVWGGPDDQTLLWALRPRRWLTAQELDSEASTDIDGPRMLVIDVDRHPLLFALIRARLAAQSAMFFDRDHNGVLDAEDRSDGEVGTGTTDPEE